MANPDFFKPAFDALATDDAIGDPNGKPAYAYIRVSSSGQAEEGRSGLPRQIEHIHEVAKQKGCRITWDMLYADDNSGFEFEFRGQLNALRTEMKKSPRARAIVMEHLDRLSRNADWYQGFLLDEMNKYGVHPIFWKSFNSRIERAVMGAIAQDAMEDAKARMREGTRNKARDGRIPAKRRRYGYKFVDEYGDELERARRMTYYAIKEDEVGAVSFIFEGIASGLYTLRHMARECNVRFPKTTGVWHASMIAEMICDLTYKGEFISHRYSRRKIDGKYQTIEHPRHEWITIPVPAIVTPDLWESANRMLDMNRATAKRNRKHSYLLAGLLKCATCGYGWYGSCPRHRYMEAKGVSDEHHPALYRCNSRTIERSTNVSCGQPAISCKLVDNTVWSVVSQVVTTPQILLDALDALLSSDANHDIADQVAYLDREIEKKQAEDENLWAAFNAKVFDVQEYKARRDRLLEETYNLKERRQQVAQRLITPEQIADRKREIMKICVVATDSGILECVRFDAKQRVIKRAVNRVILDAREHTVTLEGLISGTFPIVSSVVC